MRPPLVVVVLVALAGLAACFTLKSGTDRIDLSPWLDGGVDRGDLGDLGDCWDPTGFGGRGCYRCPPANREQLLNACTSASCIAYDNSALGLGGGGLPSLPGADMAPPPSPDMASTDLAPSAQPDLAPVLPDCASLTGGNVVYATGSSAVTLFLGQIAQSLENQSSPVTIVYQNQGSCVGVRALVTPSTNKMKGTAIYWDPNPVVDPSSSAAQLKCQLDPSGVSADIGLSDVFADTCLSLPGGLDPSIKDFFGPVQVMNFVVPQNSTARHISAEAAYLVYGFGGSQYPVMPWTDVLQIFGSPQLRVGHA